MAYEIKYRTRAVEYRKEGNTIKQTCEIFKIGESTLKSWVRKYDETGEIKDKPRKRTFKKIYPAKLEAHIEARPDDYLSEIAKVFSCSEEAVRKCLKKLKITRKKIRSVIKSKTLKK